LNVINRKKTLMNPRTIFTSIILYLFISNAILSGQDWTNFNFPKVTLQVKAKDHKGISTYLELVKEQGYSGIEDWVQHCCLAVAKELYYSDDEANNQQLKEIIYILRDGGPLSYKNGAVPVIEIGFDLNYLVGFIKDHGENAARDEIYGVLCHEITHGYQKEPKNAGVYEADSEFFAFIEGSADVVRLKTGGFNPPRFPKTGGFYTSGYNTTAFFYLWINNTFSQTFVKDLNRTADTCAVWSLDQATKLILDVPADTLWRKYQQDLESYPWENNTEKSDRFIKSLKQNTHSE